MKIYICLLIFVGVFSFASAQIAEVRVKEVTYVLDSSKKEVRNKANKIQFKLGMPDSLCEHFEMTNTSSEFKDIYRRVFTEKRISEISSSITIVSLLDKKGKAVEVYFKLYENFNKVSLNELYELENMIKNTRFKILSNCPDKQYYLFHMPCRFCDLYE